jgi:hypothetical protein
VPVEDLEDEAFLETEGTVFFNRTSMPLPARHSDRIARDSVIIPQEALAKSQSTGNISTFGFDPKIKFNNFVLESSL